MLLFFYILSYILIVTDYGITGFGQIGNLLSIPLLYLVFSQNSIKVLTFVKATLFKLGLPIFVYLLIISISFIRSGLPEAWFVSKLVNIIKLILLFLSTISVIISLSSTNKKNNIEVFLVLIYFIPSIFLLLNFAFYFTSIDLFKNSKGANQLGESVMINTLFGVSVNRVHFPLVGGINSYGTFVGGIILLSLCLSIKRSLIKNFLPFVSISILSLLSILLLDTRAAVGMVFALCCVFILAITTKRIGIISFVTFLGFFLPVILFFNFSLLMSSSFILQFIRGDGDIEGGNGRFIIWLNCFSEISRFKLIHIIGYGEFGHFGSKLSSTWGDLFNSYKNPLIAASSHNFILQSILDTGYLGLLSIIWVFITIFKFANELFSYSKNQVFILPLIFVTFFIWIGATEAVQTHKSIFYHWIIIISTVYYYRGNMEKLNLGN